MPPFLQSFMQPLAGGILIGLASWLLLAGLGRIAGISGISASAWFGPRPPAGEGGWRWAFLTGLVAAGALASRGLQVAGTGGQPPLLLAVAGLCVGFGTVLGSGCTSGHGVCGLGRRSARSLVATLIFMSSGVATVLIARSLGLTQTYG